MKVDYNFKNCILKLKFTFEKTDRREYDTHERKHVVKGRDICVYYLPKGYNLSELHPDRFALSIILNIYTFIGKRIVLPFSTSKYFNDIVFKKLKILIVNEPDRGMIEIKEKAHVRFDHIEHVHEYVKETDEELAELEAELNEVVSESELENLEKMVRGSVMDEVLTSTNEVVSETATVNASETANEDVSDSINEDVSETANEDVSETVNEDVNETVNEDVNETVNETVNEVVTDLINEDASETVNEVVSETANEDVSETDNEVVTDLINEDASETANEDICESANVDEGAIMSSEVIAAPFNVEDASSLHPGLCLSMGVDSACALTLMPEDTVCVFLDRIFPMSGETIYNKDHVYNSLQKVKSKGHKVYVVKTDMEYLRKRRGFVIDIGVGIPSILLSNHLNLRSIGYGYSIHNFTHYGKDKLLMNCTGDFCQFDHGKWNEVFKASGLFLNFITSGLTEVGTQKIVLKGPYSKIASGCMRGTVGNPCKECPKCYRKLLLEDLIKYKRIDDARGHYKVLSKSGEHKMNKIFGEFSSGLIMAYAYGLHDYKGNDVFLRSVQKRLINENNFNWKNKIKYIEKWFNGSNDRIDPLCMEYLKNKLNELKIAMTF